MGKRLTRTGFRLKLNREIDESAGSELQAIGTLIRLMGDQDLRIPFSELNRFHPETPVLKRILHCVVEIFNQRDASRMDELSSSELNVPVELGIDIDGNDILLALGDLPEQGTLSTVYWEG